MNTFLGIDPDTHDMPVAEVDEAGKLVRIDMLTVSKKLTGRDALIEMCSKLNTCSKGIALCEKYFIAVTVEGQELYQFGKSKTANPKSIMFLATVAGAAMSAYGSTAHLYMPTPQEWKGTVPKQIHQARILSRMGVNYVSTGSYSFPTSLSIGSVTLSRGDWKHAVDAIGLAQWGREQYQAEQARKARAEGSANESY